jgi:hypothetical protein
MPAVCVLISLRFSLLCGSRPCKNASIAETRGRHATAWRKPMKFVRLTVLLSLLLLASSASAATLDLDDCDSFGCEGSSIFLDVESDGSGNWNVILGIDTTNYTGNQDGIVQAGFKAIEGSSDITLVSFTDGTWSDAKFAGINSSGLCSGPGEPDFGCTSGYVNIVDSPGEYTWTFFVEGGTLIDEWSIKFQYCDEGDEACKGKIISAPGTPGTPVPEPSAALVFAGGMLIAATRLRRRR